MKITLFWDVTPFSLVKSIDLIKERSASIFSVEEQAKQARRLFFVVGLVYSSALKMETVLASETYVDFFLTIRRHISEGSTLHGHCCENFRFYVLCYFERRT
jgi:hypothetical protein